MDGLIKRTTKRKPYPDTPTHDGEKRGYPRRKSTTNEDANLSKQEFKTGGIVPKTIKKSVNTDRSILQTLAPKHMEQDELYWEMGRLKTEMKELEERYKELQEHAISEYGLDSVQTEFGTLKLSARENWSVVDKTGIIALMGLPSYKEHSSISKTGITKGIGKKGFEQAVAKKLVSLSSVSEYYQLKK